MINATEADTANGTAKPRTTENPTIRMSKLGDRAVIRDATAYSDRPMRCIFFMPIMSPSLPPRMHSPA